MRIVIDMQGLQTESRFRGIGRYTTSFVKGVLRAAHGHEIILALNGMMPHSINDVRMAFDGLLPQDHILVWDGIGPTSGRNKDNARRRKTAELVREQFLANLNPDFIHITSLFEGFGDNATVSIGEYDQTSPTSVAFYDLIPLLNRAEYLDRNPVFARIYMDKVKTLLRSDLLFAISDYTRHEAIEHLAIPANRVINVSTAIEPHFCRQVDGFDQIEFLKRFGISSSFLLYTGGADERKNLIRLVEAYSKIRADMRKKRQLVFAGRMFELEVKKIKDTARKFGLSETEIVFTGFISEEDLIRLYSLTELFIFPSWHEGFGLPVLEAMACGAPVVAARGSSISEVLALEDALFDPKDVKSISSKIEEAICDISLRDKLISYGQTRVSDFSWDATANVAMVAWTNFQSVSGTIPISLCTRPIEEVLWPSVDTWMGRELIALSSCIAHNLAERKDRQLLVDISELYHRDAATGVQRVVRSYLRWLLKHPPSGFVVRPVYATQTEGYRYADEFTYRFARVAGLCEPSEQDDEVQLFENKIAWRRGDLFFALDMQHDVQLRYDEFYQLLRRSGVSVVFLVHDLLPIEFPEYFDSPDIKFFHERLMTLISKTDGVICVSQATADALMSWFKTAGIQVSEKFALHHVPNGSDLDGSVPSTGVPVESITVLKSCDTALTFLTVSTIEPRKCQQQILDAAELLWDKKQNFNLVLVGRQGWNVDSLIERIRNHPELGKRLFWLEGISDEYLDRIYQKADCLIAASLNEGFGLPLMEAARHKIPIIARNIPVFKELAGANAWYFDGLSGVDLASSIQLWIEHKKRDEIPSSNKIKWLTWEESYRQLSDVLTSLQPPRSQLLVAYGFNNEEFNDSRFQKRRTLLKNGPVNDISFSRFSIYPIEITATGTVCYSDFWVGNSPIEVGQPVEWSAGDIFVLVDPSDDYIMSHKYTIDRLRRSGVLIVFFISPSYSGGLEKMLVNVSNPSFPLDFILADVRVEDQKLVLQEKYAGIDFFIEFYDYYDGLEFNQLMAQFLSCSAQRA